MKAKLSIYILSILFLGACNKATKPLKEESASSDMTYSKKIDSCIIDNYALAIIDSSGNAYLKSKNSSQTIEIGMKSPVYFLRDNNEVKTYAYKDISVTHTILIIGEEASKEVKKKMNNESLVFCGTILKGILLKDKTFEISNVKITGVFCRDKGIDEKNYNIIAHQ